MVLTEPEDVVRSYLTFMETTELPDNPEADKLRERLDELKDPIDKLKVLSAIEEAEITVERLETAFITVARPWAEAQDPPITASVFEQVGLPHRVLDAAFPRPVKRVPQVAARRRGRPRMVGAIGTRVRIEDVRAAIAARTEPFSIRDIADATGAYTITVSTEIHRQEAEGLLEEAGVRKTPQTRGRGPMTYQPVKKPKKK